MRLKNRIIAVAAALAGMVACTPESEMMPEVFVLNVINPNLNALQTEVKATVKCDLHWKAELEDPSWGSIEVLTENKGKGGSFVVRLEENLTEESRNNTIILKAGKAEATKTITQAGLSKFFNPRSVELTDTKEATVSFTAPAAWTASLAEDADWLNLATTSGPAGYSKIVCSAKDANENVGARETAIYLTIGEVVLDIPVSQAQKDVIRVEGDHEINLSFEAQTISLQTQYNTDYKVETDVPWISQLTTKAPLYEGVETFDVEANSTADTRTGKIVFSMGKAKKITVTVTQEGRDPVLNVTFPGFYGIHGQNYFWGEGGWNQRTSLTSAEGVNRYRLLNAKTLSVLEVDGLRFSDTDGEEMDVKVNLRNRDIRYGVQEFTVTQIAHTANIYWFKASDETYFIISK